MLPVQLLHLGSIIFILIGGHFLFFLIVMQALLVDGAD